VAVLAGHVERGTPVEPAQVGANTSRHQRLDGIQMAVPHGVVQRGVAVVRTLRVEVAPAVCGEQVEHVGVTHVRRLVRRRRAHQVVDDARIGSGAEQLGHHLDVALAGGVEQRRVPVDPPLVDVGSGGQGTADARDVAAEAGHAQGCCVPVPPAPAGSLDRLADLRQHVTSAQQGRRVVAAVRAYVGVRTALEQEGDHRRPLVPRCVDEGCVAVRRGLQVDERAVVEQQSGDVDDAGLRRLVQR